MTNNAAIQQSPLAKFLINSKCGPFGLERSRFDAVCSRTPLNFDGYSRRDNPQVLEG